MATATNYGPYASISGSGLAPDAEEGWYWTFPAYGDVIQIIAYPIYKQGAGQEGHLSVSRISAYVAPSGASRIRWRIHNIGQDPTHYAMFITVIR